MFRGLQHYMTGCSKLERLAFVEQTACNSAYLKVTTSAVAETLLSTRVERVYKGTRV